MEKLYFERFEASQVTDDMLQEASQLFNGNYGVWHEDAEQHMGPFAKAGRPVRLSVGRLRADYLTASGTYARVTTRDGRLVGNTFACRWTYDGDKNVCWVTQLVVHRDFRQRGLASGLLNLLRNDDDDFCGILSSHPAACLAAFKAFGNPLRLPDLEIIRNHAAKIMASSPAPYIKNAKLRGSLFPSEGFQNDNNDDDDGNGDSGLVSTADTGFWIDHTDPLAVLDYIRSRRNVNWPLGELCDGHEFLLILAVDYRGSGRFRSQPPYYAVS